MFLLSNKPRLGAFLNSTLLLTTTLFTVMLTACADEAPTLDQAEAVQVSTNSAANRASPHAAIKQTQATNFLVIVADDLGFSDLGFAGSEIRTPALDELATQGTVLTQFYTAPTCSPTRAMLLTGVDHHRVGLGSMHEIMSEDIRENPGYEGYLTDQVPHLPQQLRTLGYHTFMAGKWHLGLTEEQSPPARGFDRSFAMLNGGASHFADRAGLFSMAPLSSYREDGALVTSLPDDFFSSTFYTDKTLDYIDEARALGKPFFGYLAFTAPHWPLQAPDDYLNRYAGAYDAGWDTLRQQRFEAMRRLGWIPDSATLPEHLEFVSDWSQLAPAEQRRRARDMEIYAAMVEHMDAQIARVMTHLRTTGLIDSTLVLFFSDNGPEGTDALTVLGNDEWVPQRFNNSPDNLGRVNSYTSYGPGWAQVSATPFNLFKSFPTEGGVRTPAVIRRPGVFKPKALPQRSDQPVSVADIAPTLLAIASNTEIAPETAMTAPNTQPIMTGTPIDVILEGTLQGHHDDTSQSGNANDDPSAARVFAWELFGRQAVRIGQWKAVKLSPPIGDGHWQLFDLAVDPGERNNQAAIKPKRLASLVGAWERYAENNGVVPLDSDVGYGKR